MTVKTMQYNYRAGNYNDLQQLCALGLLSYGQYKSVLSEEGWKKMAAGCGNEVTYLNLLKIAQCFVCEYNNKIIGMAFLIPKGNPMAFFEAAWSYIRLIGVDPAFAGRGIGRKLTQMCIDFARSSGESLIALHTSEFQNAARHIYESMGFKKIKALDPIFNKKYWLYHLQLDLLPEDITYHRAGKNDLQQLIDLRIEFSVALTGSHSEEETNHLRKELETYFEDAIDRNSCIFYLAKSGNVIAGVGGLVIRDSPGNYRNPSGKWGYLINMYTTPLFRRKGVCGRLMDLLEKAANAEGVNAFELHATREGETVYPQHGYVIHNEPTYRKYTNQES